MRIWKNMGKNIDLGYPSFAKEGDKNIYSLKQNHFIFFSAGKKKMLIFEGK